MAADTLKLLLENGGDPNLVVDGDSIFTDVDFDIFFGAVEQHMRITYDSNVHYWMVLVGYGGKLIDGRDPVTLQPGCTLEMFKDHRNLDFCLEKEDGDYTMHIFDKRTKWEIATDEPGLRK